MLLLVIDLIAFLCLAVQFVIAGYFLYLVYWSIELPPADGTVPALPDELPRVLVQIPVYNEPLVIDRVLGAAAALDWPRDRLVDPAPRRQHRHHLRHRRPRRGAAAA